jgi:hypothetical protein
MDELQDALTSATPDPIEELKQDLGMNDEAKDTKTEEVKAKPEPSKSEEESTDTESTADVKKDAPRGKVDYRQKKIERQTAANRRQQQTINELNERIAAFENSTPANEGPKKPNMDDFDDFSKYEEANSKYQEEAIEFKAEQRIKERQEQMQRESQEREEAERYKKLSDAFTEREDRFKSRHRNYDRNAEAVLETVQHMKSEGVAGVSTLAEYVYGSEFGPNMVHYLGENLDLVDNIGSMNQIEMVKALYDIEKSLDKPSDSKKLPEPVSRLKSTADGSKSMADMSWNELSKTLNL